MFPWRIGKGIGYKEISKEDLASVESVLGHRFRDRSLLVEALSHPSKNVEEVNPTYERLAWLGDALLYHIVSERLFEMNHGASTKELHDLREMYKKNLDLAKIGRGLGLERYMITGKSRSGQEHSDYMVATMVEALIGAISLESPKHATKFIQNNILILK